MVCHHCHLLHHLADIGKGDPGPGHVNPAAPVMPKILPLLLLYTAFNIAWSVLAEAGASFLGFSDPNNITWGGMLYNLWISGKIRTAWWWFATPSICIILLVSALVFISRAYEEVANPRLKQR